MSSYCFELGKAEISLWMDGKKIARCGVAPGMTRWPEQLTCPLVPVPKLRRIHHGGWADMELLHWMHCDWTHDEVNGWLALVDAGKGSAREDILAMAYRWKYRVHNRTSDPPTPADD